MPKHQEIPAYQFMFADLITLLFELLIYGMTFFISLYPVLLMPIDDILFILIASVFSIPLMTIVFVVILVLIKRLLVREVPFGRFLLTSPKVRRWIVADRLVKIMIRSPFRPLINEMAFFRFLFYRGMGAKIDPTLLLGNGVKLPEPWALRVGRNVHIGDEAVISGHKVERNVVTLGKVEIGNHVLIGARAIIFPGVQIGDRAVVGANSVVTRGTEIGAGETWAGNPAQRVVPSTLTLPRN